MKAIAIVLGLFVMFAACNPIRGGEPNPGLKAVADGLRAVRFIKSKVWRQRSLRKASFSQSGPARGTSI
jgi:hypothetical protein